MGWAFTDPHVTYSAPGAHSELGFTHSLLIAFRNNQVTIIHPKADWISNGKAPLSETTECFLASTAGLYVFMTLMFGWMGGGNWNSVYFLVVHAFLYDLLAMQICVCEKFLFLLSTATK